MPLSTPAESRPMRIRTFGYGTAKGWSVARAPQGLVNRTRSTNDSSSILAQLFAGLVFSCTKGIVDLETPIALVQDGGHLRFAGEWTLSSHELARQLQPAALSQWWQPNHTNWDLLSWDSEMYKVTGQLIKAQMVCSFPTMMTRLIGNHQRSMPSDYAPCAALCEPSSWSVSLLSTYSSEVV